MASYLEKYQLRVFMCLGGKYYLLIINYFFHVTTNGKDQKGSGEQNKNLFTKA